MTDSPILIFLYVSSICQESDVCLMSQCSGQRQVCATLFESTSDMPTVYTEVSFS